MHIILNNSSMIPIYEQVMNAIKEEIISGKLKAGEMLPSVRGLSAELRISALTVKKTYDRLEEEGYVVTVHGKGTYVASTDSEAALEARMKSVEDEFQKAIDKAKSLGLNNEEIKEIIEIMLED